MILHNLNNVFEQIENFNNFHALNRVFKRYEP
jgi:hypothetical protein